MTHNIQDYLAGRAPRTVGGIPYIDTAEDFTHAGFEMHHELIQWMFPTMQPSQAQPHSPVLSWDEVVAIRNDEEALTGLKGHREYYAKFLSDNAGTWLRQRDHNHLRITRVIQSLSLRIDTFYAQEFLAYVAHMNATAGWPVNVESVQFWNNAKFYGKHMEAQHG